MSDNILNTDATAKKKKKEKKKKKKKRLHYISCLIVLLYEKEMFSCMKKKSLANTDSFSFYIF